MTHIAESAYKQLEETLNATNVLSEDYKKHILVLALNCYSEGVRSGAEDDGPIGGKLDTTNPTSIVEYLRDVADDDAEPVKIDYVDARGNRTTDRAIIPLEVTEPAPGWPCAALHALDVNENAPRNFRVDRIERLVA